MAKILVLHTRKDLEFVTDLSIYLRSYGHEVIFPDDDKGPGNTIIEELYDERNYDAILVIVSKNAINNNNFLFELGKSTKISELTSKDVIIPIVLDEVSYENLPSRILHYQFIKALSTSTEEVAKLIDQTLPVRQGEKSAEAQKKKEIEEKFSKDAADYVQDSITDLDKKVTDYQNKAYLLYGGTTFIILVTIGLTIFKIFNSNQEIANWHSLANNIFLYALLIGLMLALAKYTYTLGKSFMVEALRNSDRIHAIKFGQFYLNVYGDQAKWDELKEAFQYWNIDSGSFFLKQNTDQIEPNLLQNLASLFKNN